MLRLRYQGIRENNYVRHRAEWQIKKNQSCIFTADPEPGPDKGNIAGHAGINSRDRVYSVVGYLFAVSTVHGRLYGRASSQQAKEQQCGYTNNTRCCIHARSLPSGEVNVVIDSISIFDGFACLHSY